MRVRTVIVSCMALGLAYLLGWPVAVEPQAWTPPPAPALHGQWAPNLALASTRRIFTDGHGIPEDVAIGPDQYVYAGTSDGSILRMAQDGSAPQVLVNTGGRPLGMRFAPDGSLWVADGDKGLLRVTSDGHISVLATHADGVSFKLTDDLDVAVDGKVYFTDASYRFSFHDYQSDLLEHRANGRLLEYDPVTRQTRVLLKDLYFANGVAISPDQTFLLVVETGEYRVTRYWLNGAKAGHREVFIDNLPGVPDGISSNGRDTFWVALPTPRLSDLDKLLPHPFLRKMVARLPKVLQPKPTPMGFVIGLDLNGKVTHNLQDPDGQSYATITNVIEQNGKLWFGSLYEQAVGVLPVTDLPKTK
ncbi:SMP-30/gluconolactonase/LRE family protein [Chitinivorax sp. B]|uniref:SMP-30/gluconolactonase/LRE family protein n=1 Tax=Chitinivorax sp. B TaxID=2502235 RepID=UPI0010F63658|nr:SMP-30/gluconolactonase/LRE family protein [Chitinivorax sp. B]